MSGFLDDREHAARFFVRRSARGAGLGRRLVEEGCWWAKEREMRVVMNVLSKDVDAMRLYEKVGFRRIARPDAADHRSHTTSHIHLAPGNGGMERFYPLPHLCGSI